MAPRSGSLHERDQMKADFLALLLTTCHRCPRRVQMTAEF